MTKPLPLEMRKTKRVGVLVDWSEWRVDMLCEMWATGRIVTGYSLRLGITSSCGCLKGRRTHGRYRTKSYIVWTAMKGRCNNPNNHKYKQYGGRGIVVCRGWNESFENFYADMGDPPAGLTLERKDVNGNYEPSNCCWATHKVQGNNHRKHIRVSVSGVEMNLSQACERLGLSYTTVYSRMFAYGWSEQRALGLSQ